MLITIYHNVKIVCAGRAVTINRLVANYEINHQLFCENNRLLQPYVQGTVTK